MQHSEEETMCVHVLISYSSAHRQNKLISLTIFVQEKLIEAQATGLLPNETVHILCAVVVDSNSILQRLDTGLQTEGDFCVSYSVSTNERKIY